MRLLKSMFYGTVIGACQKAAPVPAMSDGREGNLLTDKIKQWWLLGGASTLKICRKEKHEGASRNMIDIIDDGQAVKHWMRHGSEQLRQPDSYYQLVGSLHISNLR